MGASLKSRSSRNICRFSDGTTPRSSGEDFKTQNRKNKSEHIAFRNCRIYRRSRDGWREKISGRRKRRFAAREAAPPPYGQPGGGGVEFVGNAYDRQPPSIPRYGKVFGEFSTLWKIFGRFFHAMEKLFANFPHNGKTFSTVWKTRISGCFQGVRAVLRGCGAKRAAPHVSRNARPTEGPGKPVPDAGGQRTQPRPLRVRRSERPFFSVTRSGISRAFRRNGGGAREAIFIGGLL